jgi:hypothetical protein
MKDKLKKALAILKKAARYLGELIGILEKATKEEKKS